MTTNQQEICELAEIVHAKPLSGEFEEELFGSDRGNTLWVKFSSKAGVTEWIGKFGAGISDAIRVSKVEEPDVFLVSAGGFAYLINATNRQIMNQFCNEFVCDVAYDSEAKEFIVTDGTRLRIINSGQEIWSSKRIALDGIRDLKAEGRTISGLAVVGYKGEEEKFTFNLDTRQVKIGTDFSSWDHLIKWFRCG